jgi:hypothetical protein
VVTRSLPLVVLRGSSRHEECLPLDQEVLGLVRRELNLKHVPPVDQNRSIAVIFIWPFAFSKRTV